MTIECRFRLTGAKISPKSWRSSNHRRSRAGAQRNEKKRKEREKKEKRKRKEREKKEKSKRKQREKKADFQVKIALRLSSFVGTDMLAITANTQRCQ
jgi:hypothetical protein